MSSSNARMCESTPLIKTERITTIRTAVLPAHYYKEVA